MKNIVFSLCLFALAIIGGAASAYETPLKDVGSKKLLEKHVEMVQKYADQFGCGKFVYGDIVSKSGGQIVTMQFMPPDLEEPTKWTRMLSVTTYALSGDKVADQAAQKNLIELLRTQFIRPGNVVSADQNYLINWNADPALFIQYTTGRGTPQEVTYAGSFMRTGETTASFIQLSARGRPLKKSESVNMHLLVNPTADQPERPRR